MEVVRLWRIALQFHHLHLAGVQAHRRVVAHLLTTARTGGIHQAPALLAAPTCPAGQHPPESGPRRRRISWFPFVVPPLPCSAAYSPTKASRRAGSALSNRFFGRFSTESQPAEVVQIRQRRTPAQRQPEAIPHKLAHCLPVPVGQVDARPQRRSLHRRLQFPALLHVQRGGEPPLCSKTNALGPPSAKALAHWPMVWASRSRARPHRRCGPTPVSSTGQALSQQPYRVPSFPFPGRRRSIHPPSYLSLVHAPPHQQRSHLLHAQLRPPAVSQPAAPTAPNSTRDRCGLHLGLGLAAFSPRSRRCRAYSALLCNAASTCSWP